MTSEKAQPTILNVDDDDTARYATSRILRKEGFNVIEAGNGTEALQLVKQAPDLVLLDVNLPDMSGFEVCRMIKEDPATALIPVLHLSATYMDDRSKVKGLDTGADGYLTYPVEPPVVIAYINSLLRIGRAQKELEEVAEKWRTTFDAMEEAVSLLDKEQKFLQCNTSMKELVRKPFREIIGRCCWEVVHGTSEPVKGCPIMRMRETLRRETLVVPIGEQWIDVAVNPLLDGDGTLVGAVHVMRDITSSKQAEEKLQASEEKYRSLVESTEDSIYLVDRECRYLFMNKKHLSRFGLLLHKVMGRPYGEFHSEKETTEFSGKVKAVFEAGKSLSYEYRSERDGGYYIRTLSPVEAADGETIAVTVDSKDITQHKQAEEALRKYEQEKALILDSMSEHVVYRDTKMRVLWANRAAGESVGLAPEQFAGRYCYEIWHQRNKPCVVCPAKETLKTGQQEEMEVTTPDGRIWWIRTYPIRDANGDITKIANVTQEITDRKRAEEALKESEAQKTAILDGSVDRIRLVDKDMKIIWANKTAMREYNIAPEDLIGYPCYRIFFDRNAPCDGCPSKKTLETGQIEHAVVHQPYLKGIEGESYWDNHSVPIKNESGDIVNLIQITRNITKQVLAEKRLKSSQEELRNLADHLQSVREEERTTIAREIHDELGQALAALKMDISWLGKRLPKDQESLLEKVRSISTLTDMTIKAVKRISTELRPGLLDDLGLAAAIEWQVEEFQDRTGLTCKFVVEPEDIAVDEKRSTVIFRILQEALTNVARHAQATRVTVSFKEKAHKWVLRIRDNGKGITEKQIFDPQSFGLMGMRERVRMWGGEVKIKGVPDKGTTVAVSIPVDTK